MEIRLPKKAKEVLVLLADAGVLEFRRTPAGYFRLLSENKSAWKRFQRKTLLYAIRALYRDGLITIEETPEGITTVGVTEAGKKAAKEKTFLSERPKEWDKKWRLIFFDIPEEKKKFRDAFRYHLQKMGATEFQRSAFIFPYPCSREVGALAEKLSLREHIVLVTAETLSNEFKFKEHFGLV
ncbi:MAG: hypothetical protein AAB730_01145 [Patescibacteria group bacterium]